MTAIQGFGCMGWSAFYPSAHTMTEDRALEIFKVSLAKGVTLFNSAVFYGPLTRQGYGANLRLLGKCMARCEAPRESYQLMVKIGMDTRPPENSNAPYGTTWNIMSSSSSLLADVDYALEQLKTDYIDIIVLCRVNPAVPIEETILIMKDIVQSGKAKRIGLSEASAETIRRACAVTPIYCIEQEWSLWTRDIEDDIVPLCRKLGIIIVAYSPLGRGFLTNTIQSHASLDDNDYRKHGQPRFSTDNFHSNLVLVQQAEVLAKAKEITMSQLALAFLHAQGPDVIPIPGTSFTQHLEENLAARDIVLSVEELEILNGIFTREKVQGNRYTHMAMTYHGQIKSCDS
jgi:aryl-alcohol dehydrogenase-like predicted oxidoreductase